MKKIIVLIITLAAVVLPLAAGNSYIGLAGGADIHFYKTDPVTRFGGVYVAVEGANYFGAKGNLGVSYSLSGIYSLTETQSGNTEKSDVPISWSINAALQYKVVNTSKFDLSLGLGGGYTLLKSWKLNITDNNFVAYADVKAIYNPVSNVAVFGGIKVGSVVASWLNGQSNPQLNIWLTPYIGCGYSY